MVKSIKHFEEKSIKIFENLEDEFFKHPEQMAEYISQMIGLFFDGQDPETCEIPAQDACTHDCCTCGGCH